LQNFSEAICFVNICVATALLLDVDKINRAKDICKQALNNYL